MHNEVFVIQKTIHRSKIASRFSFFRYISITIRKKTVVFINWGSNFHSDEVYVNRCSSCQSWKLQLSFVFYFKVIWRAVVCLLFWRLETLRYILTVLINILSCHLVDQMRAEENSGGCSVFYSVSHILNREYHNLL